MSLSHVIVIRGTVRLRENQYDQAAYGCKMRVEGLKTSLFVSEITFIYR